MRSDPKLLLGDLKEMLEQPAGGLGKLAERLEQEGKIKEEVQAALEGAVKEAIEFLKE